MSVKRIVKVNSNRCEVCEGRVNDLVKLDSKNVCGSCYDYITKKGN